jgi:hypothetical protein
MGLVSVGLCLHAIYGSIAPIAKKIATESGEENDHICMRADAAEYFLEHWGTDNVD